MWTHPRVFVLVGNLHSHNSQKCHFLFMVISTETHTSRARRNCLRLKWIIELVWSDGPTGNHCHIYHNSGVCWRTDSEKNIWANAWLLLHWLQYTVLPSMQFYQSYFVIRSGNVISAHLGHANSPPFPITGSVLWPFVALWEFLLAKRGRSVSTMAECFTSWKCHISFLIKLCY